MNNTINNVLRELLERICTMNFMGLDIDNEVAEIRKFLSCASPVPIKELSASAKVKEYEDVDGDTQHSIHFTKQKMPHGTELCRLSDAQAIIDGLRGEVAGLRKRAKTAEREAGSALRAYKGLEKVARVVSDNSDQVCGELNVLRQQFDQQAQRIGELASHLEFAVTMLTVAGLAGNAQVESMRSALSAGKEGE